MVGQRAAAVAVAMAAICLTHAATHSTSSDREQEHHQLQQEEDDQTSSSSPPSSASSTESSSSGESNEYLQVGRSLNLLPRYGFLTLSIKVFPHRNEDNDWLFREKTAEVLQRNWYWLNRNPFRSQISLADPPAPPPVQPEGPAAAGETGGTGEATAQGGGGRGVGSEEHEGRQRNRSYDQHFLIDFCDDSHQLLTAYFDNFYVEGVPEPHKAFTASISARTLAQHLGLHPTYLAHDYSYVLVRLFRRTRRSTLGGRLTLTSHFREAVRDIRVGSTESVHQFLDRYGTHVITEYEVGDVMYQVYVFGNRTYAELKANFATSQSSQNELTRMERYFTPYYAMYVGRVRLASGNPLFEETVGDELLSVTYFRVYHSIFAIFKEHELEQQLESLEGNVVLGLKLEKITKILPKSPERHWLGEILDNTLTLYYVTM